MLINQMLHTDILISTENSIAQILDDKEQIVFLPFWRIGKLLQWWQFELSEIFNWIAELSTIQNKEIEVTYDQTISWCRT